MTLRGPRIRSLVMRGVSKEYHGVVAIRDLTRSFESGQVIGVVGPNGAGKTTLLRLAADLLRPSRGTITALDDRGDALERRRQLSSYIPDTPDLFPYLTVFEHLKFVGLAHSVEGWEAEANSLLEAFELDSKRDALAFELSRGMKQNLMICLSLLALSGIVLLDEPSAGLDPMGAETLRASVRSLCSVDRIVLVSSHNLPRFEETSDRILFLRRGELVGDTSRDSLERLLSETKSTFESYFLEVMRDED